MNSFFVVKGFKQPGELSSCWARVKYGSCLP
jgi:hypothetical protein